MEGAVGGVRLFKTISRRLLTRCVYRCIGSRGETYNGARVSLKVKGERDLGVNEMMDLMGHMGRGSLKCDSTQDSKLRYRLNFLVVGLKRKWVWANLMV